MYKNILEENLDSSTYLIHDNGGRPFMVYVNKNNFVNIYSVPNDKYYSEDECNCPDYYVNLITGCKAEKIFIGKSKFNEMTSFSGGYGDYFDGNSILLYLGNYQYMHIGIEIYKFTTNGDIINEYHSPVGNNDVPYPFAKSSDYIYFMLDTVCLPRSIYDKHVENDSDDAYSYFYGHKGNIVLSKDPNITDMGGFEIVHKRIW